jgi:putative hydrolase of the HAD superfamily
MKTPSDILIDLDDTIIDDSGSLEECWQQACREGAARLPGLDAGALRAAIELRRDWYWSDAGRHRTGRHDLRAATREIVRQAFAEMGLDRLDVATEIAKRYRDLREERVCLFPGAVEALERLRGMGVRLGMITNGGSAGQRAKIERFALAPYFDHILIEGEFGLGKPHPQVYEAALQALGSELVHAWSVGDNLEWDVGAPQALGVYSIWVDGQRSGLPAGATVRPNRIIQLLSELL